jgi:hypothetical protein
MTIDCNEKMIDVFAFARPNSSTMKAKNTPNDQTVPHVMTWIAKHAPTTTQP